MKALMLSAYDAESHAYWRQGLYRAFSSYEWTTLTLPPRYFSWRIRGNGLTWFQNPALKERYDICIATSMVDLATLKGLNPSLASLPTLLYFHENQFAYPVNKYQKGLLEIQIRTLFAAISADFLTFNSNHNLTTFLQGVDSFCQKMPDGLPHDLVQQLANKSNVMAVPINDDCRPSDTDQMRTSNTLSVVWNHRWEHDKGPEILLELMRLCQTKTFDSIDLKFHILGQRFRKMPDAMTQIIQHHKHQCVNLGFIESRKQYIEILQSADLVLSTAHHDFQGISMLEAVASGCLPIAPKRLVYPELYPRSNLYPSTPDQPELEAQSIMKLLINRQQLQSVECNSHWHEMKTTYNNWLEQQMSTHDFI